MIQDTWTNGCLFFPLQWIQWMEQWTSNPEIWFNSHKSFWLQKNCIQLDKIIQWRVQGKPPPTSSKFFQFHAVLGKYFAK